MASVTVEISGDVAAARIADPLAILSNNGLSVSKEPVQRAVDHGIRDADQYLLVAEHDQLVTFEG
jgi:hypothetical protein